MGKLILILGGARSGKSTFAEAKAREFGGDEVLFASGHLGLRLIDLDLGQGTGRDLGDGLLKQFSGKSH